MAWSERQVGLLAELGIRLWQPALPQAEPEAESDADSEMAEMAETAELADAVVAEPRIKLRRDPRPAPAADIGALGWPALRSAVEHCTACALCEGRSRAVFGSGHPRAHWLVVGEAPLEAEDAAGQPFVGAAGQLLANMLRAVGVRRLMSDPADLPDLPDTGAPESESESESESDGDGDPAHHAYATKLLKCRPPGPRNPTPAELAQCEGFLRRQIELVQPKVILALGRFAVRHLLRSDEPLGKLRGRVHDFHGVPLVFSYDPEHLMRQPQDKARAWEDLCLAQSLAQRVTQRLNPREG